MFIVKLCASRFCEQQSGFLGTAPSLLFCALSALRRLGFHFLTAWRLRALCWLSVPGFHVSWSTWAHAHDDTLLITDVLVVGVEQHGEVNNWNEVLNAAHHNENIQLTDLVACFSLLLLMLSVSTSRSLVCFCDQSPAGTPVPSQLLVVVLQFSTTFTVIYHELICSVRIF